MNKLKKILAATMIAAGLKANALSAKAQTTALEIVFTCDLYAALASEGSSPGFAKLASAIASYDGANAIVIDAGNATTGSAFEGIYEDAPVYRVMGKMGYDVIGIGSDDLIYGGDKYRRMLNNTDDEMIRLIPANADINAALSRTYANKGGTGYAVIARNGYKIGIFSVISETDGDDVISFFDAYEAAGELVGELENEGCDLIICLSPVSVEENIKLAEEVAGIDLIISRGDADNKLTTVNNTAIAACGSHGEYLGVISVNDDMEVTGNYLARVSQYAEPQEEQPEDTEEEGGEEETELSLTGLIAQLKEQVDDEYLNNYKITFSQSLVRATADYSREDTARLTGAAMAYAALKYGNIGGVVLGLTQTDSVRKTITSGSITTGEAYSAFDQGVYNNEPGDAIAVIRMYGRDLYTLVEYCLLQGIDLSLYNMTASYADYRMDYSKVYSVTAVTATGLQAVVGDREVFTVACPVSLAEKLLNMAVETEGILDPAFYNIQGERVYNVNNLILMRSVGNDEEAVRLWGALLVYLESETYIAPEDNGTSVIPKKNFDFVTYITHLSTPALKTLIKGGTYALYAIGAYIVMHFILSFIRRRKKIKNKR